ncbi:hypothetical protein CEXT_590091 [Caerostris extrusa]|uniref:Uncharacterized protein n=1 Tax=Caerostris extrusa TaxID=172846 RepID=A0AAV4XUN5_CAEEX|nr:hypothetical protein CEXT_590091 [Caerostris extrusa]
MSQPFKESSSSQAEQPLAESTTPAFQLCGLPLAENPSSFLKVKILEGLHSELLQTWPRHLNLLLQRICGWFKGWFCRAQSCISFTNVPFLN